MSTNRGVAFVNTGFPDRKGDMKSSAWIGAYEKNNVLVGLMRLARIAIN
ncbi:MAG: hypothetical protein WB542_10765 [Polaromonas sp.]